MCYLNNLGIANMDNFLIDIVFDDHAGNYVARTMDGNDVVLSANTYQDAVLEADMAVYTH